MYLFPDNGIAAHEKSISDIYHGHNIDIYIRTQRAGNFIWRICNFYIHEYI